MLRLKREDYKEMALFFFIFFSLIGLFFNLKLKIEVEKAKGDIISIFSESRWKENLFMKSLNVSEIERMTCVYKADSLAVSFYPEFYVLLILATYSCNACIESEIQNWNTEKCAKKVKVLAVGDSGITKMSAFFYSVALHFPVYIDPSRDMRNFLDLPDETSAVIILDHKQRVIDAYFADFQKKERNKQKTEKLLSAL